MSVAIRLALLNAGVSGPRARITPQYAGAEGPSQPLQTPEHRMRGRAEATRCGRNGRNEKRSLGERSPAVTGAGLPWYEQPVPQPMLT